MTLKVFSFKKGFWMGGMGEFEKIPFSQSNGYITGLAYSIREILLYVISKLQVLFL